MSEPPRQVSPLKRAALRFVHSLEEPGPFATWSIEKAHRIAGLLALLNLWTLVVLVAMVLGLPLSAALATPAGFWFAGGSSILFLIAFGFWIQADVPNYRPRVEIGLETDRQSYARQLGIAWYIGLSLISALLVFYAYANWSR